MRATAGRQQVGRAHGRTPTSRWVGRWWVSRSASDGVDGPLQDDEFVVVAMFDVGCQLDEVGGEGGAPCGAGDAGVELDGVEQRVGHGSSVPCFEAGGETCELVVDVSIVFFP